MYRQIFSEIDRRNDRNIGGEDWGEWGVSHTSFRELIKGYGQKNPEQLAAIHHEIWPDKSDEEDGGVEDEQRRPAEFFSAEYIGFADVSILLASSNSRQERIQKLLDAEVMGGGIQYWPKSAQDLAWGIALDMDTMVSVKSDVERSGRCWRDFAEIFLFFNLYHEHFHYLTEMAALNLSSGRNSFHLYDFYVKNTRWGEWNCKLERCCRISSNSEIGGESTAESAWLKTVEFSYGKNAKGVVDYQKCVCWTLCGNPISCQKCGIGFKYKDKCEDCEVRISTVLPSSKQGFQYPLEEAMANAYAIRKLRRNKNFENWKIEAVIGPWIDDFLRGPSSSGQPLGYREYPHFLSEKSFKLGQRILTRMLEVNPESDPLENKYPSQEINILQHLLIDGEDVESVIEKESELFSGWDCKRDAYHHKIVNDDLKEVPILILNRNLDGETTKMATWVDEILKIRKR